MIVAKLGIQSKGNVAVTGSVVASSFTGSLAGTASYALGIPTIKSGAVSGSQFSGNPKRATVTFSTPFNGNYSISITGETSIMWSVESKTQNGFIINANRNGGFTNMVYWQAITIGEFYS